MQELALLAEQCIKDLGKVEYGEEIRRMYVELLDLIRQK
jgi:hypothetical protein